MPNLLVTKPARLVLITLIICGWFALLSQLYLILENRTAAIAETIVRYFSFFTIITNLIVAVCCTILLSRIHSGLKIFFEKINTLTAIAAYISIVSLVYNTILRFLWKPQGLQWIVDELLHTVIPVLFIAFWLFFVPKAPLRLKSVLAWLLYPVIYLAYVLARGSVSSFYPYPFIDVTELGYNKVLINSTGMLLAFLAVSFFFVLINRFKKY